MLYAASWPEINLTVCKETLYVSIGSLQNPIPHAVCVRDSLSWKVGPFSHAKADTRLGFWASPVTSTALLPQLLTTFRLEKVSRSDRELFCNLTRHIDGIYLLEYQHKRSHSQHWSAILLKAAVIPTQISDLEVQIRDKEWTMKVIQIWNDTDRVFIFRRTIPLNQRLLLYNSGNFF